MSSTKVTKIEKSPQKNIIESPKKNEITNQYSEEENFYQNPNQPREKIRDFIIIKEIGQGAFGSVFLVEKETNKKKIRLESNKQRLPCPN